MKKIKLQVAIFMASFITPSVFASAPVSELSFNSPSKLSVEKRIDNMAYMLENKNKMQIQMQDQINSLSTELSQLKGEIELLHYKLKQVSERQRNLYKELAEKQNAKPGKKQQEKSIPIVAIDESSSYQGAVDLVLLNKDYPKAITAFEGFIKRYPDSKLVANSQYWLGQLLYKQQKRAEAKKAFLVVTEKFPDSNKRSDSLFKIGIIEEYAGNIEAAKKHYAQVIEEYPETSASKLALKRLSSF